MVSSGKLFHLGDKVMSMLTKIGNRLKEGGLRGLGLCVCQLFVRKLSREGLAQKDNGEVDEIKMPIGSSIDRYRFIGDHPFGSEIKPENIDLNTINWFVPNFENSSGGHLTIFRLIGDLEKLGFKNRVIFETSQKNRTVDEIRKAINENFLPLNCPISIGIEAVPPAYFSFATNWTTAYLLKNFISTVEKCYFLQDYEPYFYPPGTDYFLADRTYSFGFRAFSGGSWIAKQLKAKHDVNAQVFCFGCDQSFYVPAAENEKAGNIKRLLFYARPSTPRRGFELAMLAFEQLLAKVPDVEIVLAGCDLSDYSLPEGIKSVGIVAMPDLPKLYRSCDAALIISFTNVSLLPLDLMASGCAVVSNSGPQVEWLLNKQIAMLTDPEPYSLFLALEKILTDDSLRATQIRSAYDFVAGRNWFTEAKLIGDLLRKMQSKAKDGCQERQMGAVS